MKDLREQMDKFLEDVFNGNITTIMHKKIDSSGKELPLIVRAMMASVGQKGPDTIEGLIERWSDLVPVYLKEKGHTEKNAYTLYNFTIALRFLAVFENDPNNLKELGYWKDRDNDLAKENETLRGQVKDAYTMIDRLQLQVEDLKKGKNGSYAK